MKSLAESLIDTIVKIEKWIAFSAFVLMLGALAADVIGREIFGHGVFGAVSDGRRLRQAEGRLPYQLR